MKKTFLITIFVILIIGVFIPLNYLIGNLGIQTILIEAMNSRTYIYTEENDRTFFNKYELSDGELAVVSKYTFVDLDNDKTKEMVILTKSTNETYIVLRYDKKKNKVYVYKVKDLKNFEIIDMNNFRECSSKNKCKWHTYGIS